MNGSLIQETSSDGCELVQRNAILQFGNSSVFNFSKETGSALSLLSSQRCLKVLLVRNLTICVIKMFVIQALRKDTAPVIHGHLVMFKHLLAQIVI